jgi:SAM-dependent methyltransferase
LDVGCGDKPYQPLFAPRVTEHLGVDFEGTFKESKYAKASKADFIYSGDRLPFEDAEFDTVLSTQVLEHTPTPWVLFAEMSRLLKPGGTLIVTIPFSYRVHSEPYDFYRFTRYALASLAEANGLDVVDIRPRGGFWAVIGQKLCSYLALTAGRMGRQAQESGSFGYEKEIQERPRYWALPFVVPAILAAATACRILDRLAFNECDTLGYFLVAQRGVES